MIIMPKLCWYSDNGPLEPLMYRAWVRVGEIFNICANFNLSNTVQPPSSSHHFCISWSTSSILQNPRHQDQSMKYNEYNVSQCCIFSVYKIINTKQGGMQPPNLNNLDEYLCFLYVFSIHGVEKTPYCAICAAFRCQAWTVMVKIHDVILKIACR